MLKFGKKGIITFLVAALVMVFASGAWAATSISDVEGLKEAFAKGGEYQLTEDLTLTGALSTDQKVTLDVAGHTIFTSYDISVGDETTMKGGNLTLNNTAAITGGITLTVVQDYGAKIYGNKLLVYGNTGPEPTAEKSSVDSVLTINTGVKIHSESGYYTVYVCGKGATLNLNGGEIIASQKIGAAAIQGNGRPENGGTTININSGKVEGGPILDSNKESGCAIYHPQDGVLKISGGTITGYDGVQLKAGKLVMTGGVIKATGAKPEKYPDSSNGSVVTACAISLISNESYTGDINVDISGKAELESTKACAVFSKITVGDNKVNKIEISGGSFRGGDQALLLEDAENIDISLTGGSYSSNPSAYVADREKYVIVEKDGKYVVEQVYVNVAPESIELWLNTQLKKTAKLEPTSNKTGATFKWESSTPTIVSVDQTGNITALAVGSADVTARETVSGASGTCQVTVRKAGPVTVSPASVNLVLNASPTAQLTASCDKAESVTWQSSDGSIVTVDNSGTVTAVKEGKANVTATGKTSGFSDTCAVTVSRAKITMTPNTKELVLNISQTAALAASSDFEEELEWSSNNTEVVSVDQKGNITALAVGSADVTAKGKKSLSVGTCAVNVRAANPVEVTPLTEEFILNISPAKQLTATCDAAESVTWNSDKTDIVTVDDSGKITAIGLGTANVTATGSVSGFKSAPCVVTVRRANISVTPTEVELILGIAPTYQLEADSEVTDTYTWTSANKDIVTVDDSGKITAKKDGTANVTATGIKSGSVASCTVTVRTAEYVVVTPSKMELAIGATGKLSVRNDKKDSITWESSDTAVATVKDGTVTAVKAGITVITANGLHTSAACTVTVTDPASPDPVTPTPAPVAPGTVNKENNPVNKEEGKPENVEAATPAITEATEEGKAAVVSATKIEEKNLVATADGKLTISPVLAKSALEEVISADATVAPKNVVLLPIVQAAVTANNVAALAFTMTGEQLGAEENTVAGDVKVIKVLADGKGGQFSYASAAADYADKTFTLKDADGKSLALTDKVAKASTYTLVVFVADNGDFDLDATAGSVIDPVAVATNAATEPKSGGSSSGCNGGFGALALLAFAVLPFIRREKR